MLLLEDSDMEELLAGSTSNRRRSASSNSAEVAAGAAVTTAGQTLVISAPGADTARWERGRRIMPLQDDLHLDFKRVRRSTASSTMNAIDDIDADRQRISLARLKRKAYEMNAYEAREGANPRKGRPESRCPAAPPEEDGDLRVSGIVLEVPCADAPT